MRKKIISTLILAGAIGMTLTACGTSTASSGSSASSAAGSTVSESASSESTGNSGSASSESTGTGSDSTKTSSADSSKKSSSGKTLIVYMTEHENTGVDATTSASLTKLDGKSMGKTEAIAHIIQDRKGGDLHSVRVADAYPSDWDSLTKAAQDEQSDGTYPKLKNDRIRNLDSYDTVYVGFPTWWMDMPQAMYSFFRDNDLSGKTVYLFNASQSSGFSGAIDQIKKLEPKAHISSSTLEVSDSDVENGNLEKMTRDWISGK